MKFRVFKKKHKKNTQICKLLLLFLGVLRVHVSVTFLYLDRRMLYRFSPLNSFNPHPLLHRGNKLRLPFECRKQHSYHSLCAARANRRIKMLHTWVSCFHAAPTYAEVASAFNNANDATATKQVKLSLKMQKADDVRFLLLGNVLAGYSLDRLSTFE